MPYESFEKDHSSLGNLTLLEFYFNKCQDCKDTNGFDLTLWSLLEKMQFLAQKYIITVFYETL